MALSSTRGVLLRYACASRRPAAGARDLVVDEACERYLVQLWPTTVSEHEVNASISNPIRRSGTVAVIGPESVVVDDGPRCTGSGRWLQSADRGLASEG